VANTGAVVVVVVGVTITGDVVVVVVVVGVTISGNVVAVVEVVGLTITGNVVVVVVVVGVANDEERANAVAGTAHVHAATSTTKCHRRITVPR
jgi:hypothetical protein